MRNKLILDILDETHGLVEHTGRIGVSVEQKKTWPDGPMAVSFGCVSVPGCGPGQEAGRHRSHHPLRAGDPRVFFPGALGSIQGGCGCGVGDWVLGVGGGVRGGGWGGEGWGWDLGPDPGWSIWVWVNFLEGHFF